MGLAIFTLIHVLISLAGIGTGFAVVGGWLGGKHLPKWTAWFLATTALTSITGFFFPFKGFTPPYRGCCCSALWAWGAQPFGVFQARSLCASDSAVRG